MRRISISPTKGHRGHREAQSAQSADLLRLDRRQQPGFALCALFFSVPSVSLTFAFIGLRSFACLGKYRPFGKGWEGERPREPLFGKALNILCPETLSP